MIRLTDDEGMTLGQFTDGGWYPHSVYHDGTVQRLKSCGLLQPKYIGRDLQELLNSAQEIDERREFRNRQYPTIQDIETKFQYYAITRRGRKALKQHNRFVTFNSEVQS